MAEYNDIVTLRVVPMCFNHRSSSRSMGRCSSHPAMPATNEPLRGRIVASLLFSLLRQSRRSRSFRCRLRRFRWRKRKRSFESVRVYLRKSVLCLMKRRGVDPRRRVSISRSERWPADEVSEAWQKETTNSGKHCWPIRNAYAWKRPSPRGLTLTTETWVFFARLP